jgi:hypothetical protein
VGGGDRRRQLAPLGLGAGLMASASLKQASG